MDFTDDEGISSGSDEKLSSLLPANASVRTKYRAVVYYMLVLEFDKRDIYE